MVLGRCLGIRGPCPRLLLSLCLWSLRTRISISATRPGCGHGATPVAGGLEAWVVEPRCEVVILYDQALAQHRFLGGIKLNKTPFEAAFRKVLDLSHLRILDSDTYALKTENDPH